MTEEEAQRILRSPTFYSRARREEANQVIAGDRTFDYPTGTTRPTAPTSAGDYRTPAPDPTAPSQDIGPIPAGTTPIEPWNPPVTQPPPQPGTAQPPATVAPPPPPPDPGWQPPGDASTGIPIPSTPFGSDDPQTMAEQDRLAARAWGQGIDQDARDAQNAYQNQEAHYRDWQMQGPGGYRDIMEGRGGFDPTQEGNILQRDMLEGGMATGDQLTDQYLTPNEQQSIGGSPYAARDIAAGQLTGLQSMQGESEARQREAIGKMDTDLRGAVDPSNLRVRGDYFPEMQRLISNSAQGYGNIINPDQLAVRPEYFDSTGQTIGNLAAGYEQAIDPQYLGLSGEFQQDYAFSDRDAQDVVDRAGSETSLRATADRDAFLRGSAAAGNTNPLAIQAAVSRNRIQGDMSAASAMTDARIKAAQMRRDTAGGRETMRLGAERDISGRATGALENLAGTELSQANIGESMRLSAEQRMADQAMQAQSEVTGRALGATEGYEDRRLGAERDVSNRQMAVGSELGQTRLGAEQYMGGQQQDLGRYTTGMVTGLTQSGESESARRAYDLARNRQDTGYGNIDTRFSQAYPASTALSGRYGSVYGQQKGEEAEGRSYLGGQQEAAQAGAQTTRQQRIQAGAVSQGGTGQATNTALSASYAPKTWGKLLSAGIGAASAFAPTGGG